MITISSSHEVQPTANIPYVTAGEAYSLLNYQFNQFLNQVKSLEPSDWSLPTACNLWNVRDILAHQAGGYASGVSYREFIRQSLAIRSLKQLPEDAINALQLRERENKSPAELIKELQSAGPAAIRNWAYGFGFAKLFSIPHPVAGTLPLKHLMWVIHSRDTWMHRLDICRATGQKFEQMAEQDGRIVELVMLDVAKAVTRSLGEVCVLFDLLGTGGGAWKVGPGEPSAIIQMDVLDFNNFASGRYTFEETCARSKLSGDVALANQVLRKLLIVY